MHACGAVQELLDRLRNETTRLAAVKAFIRIAQSRLQVDMSPVLEPLLAELTSYLRKANRQLRQASLAALEVGGSCPSNGLSLQGWEAFHAVRRASHTA
jgi:cullin-associated NEDD8-dissociated protein 1